MSSIRRSRWPAMIAAGFVLASTPSGASSQPTGFVGIGAGAGVPAGQGRAAMNNGWLTELMAGLVLPGNFMSLRVGGTFGESRVDGMAEDMSLPGPPVEAGTSRLIGGMAGVMVMPDWDWDWYPYAHAGAGLLNARFHGSATSFAWSAGAGAVLESRTVDFYVEGRFMQARKDGGRGGMGSVTAGVRLPF